jgi:6-phosphogluconate dehydrogenase
VLRVRAGIANLYVNAPDTMSAGRTRTYAVSAGEMTLVAELLDSETGSIVSRVIDRREAQGTGTMTLTNSVVNAAEARSIASSWARILRSRLDAAHGIGRK